MINDFTLDYSDLSCGLRELTGVNSSDTLAFKLLVAGKIDAFGENTSLRTGFTYLFSDNFVGNGKNIAKLIKQHKLGRLTSCPWTQNPSSGNKIKTWIWTWNGRTPRAWTKLKVPPVEVW